MPASMHIRNARIWTGDPQKPWASGMAIHEGVVASLEAAGSGSVRNSGRVIDARRRVIVPGLIDSHMHVLMGGKSLSEVDLSHARSREQFERAIAEAHARLPDGQWLIGRGWNEANWPGHQLPDKSWLAAAGGAGGVGVVGGRPCVCHRMDIHASLVNEPVLAMCNAAKRRDPPGGRMVRDPATGQPTGLMQEAAAWELVNPLIPDLDVAAKRECLLTAQKHAHALGLTAVGSMEFARDVDEVLRPLRDQATLSLRCRVTLLDRGWPMAFDFGRDFANDDRLAVIGYKTFIDGTLGSRTARMLADYADDAGGPGKRGMLVELAASGHLQEWAQAVAREGLSPSMHAIGDEANRIALDVLAAVDETDRTMSRDSRARIEHVQHLDRGDLARWRGRIASMQPLHKAADASVIVERLGPERARGAYAFRDLANSGAILAFGSDWPVVSCDPLLGMRAAITGLTFDEQPFGVEQNLSVEESLRAYTRDAAYCLRLDQAGVLREGMLGDCVMFDIDPFTADWVRRPPRVFMTIVGGEVVFDETHEEAVAHAR